MLGVLSLVLIIAIGEGARKSIERQFAMLGTNVVVIQQRELGSQERRSAAAVHTSQLSVDDARLIESGFEEVEGVVPEIDFRSGLVEPGFRSMVNVRSTTAAFFASERITVRTGRPLLDDDVARRGQVAIVSDDLLWRLNLVDKAAIRLDRSLFLVVGTFSWSNREFANAASEVLPEVLIPLGSERDVRSGMTGGLSQIIVRLNKEADAISVSEAMEEALVEAHEGIRNFELMSPESLIRERNEASRSLRSMLVMVSIVSLFIGAAGITNVMLAALNERKREIGLMRSLGATRRDASVLLLVEAVLLSGAGGGLGIVLAVVVGALIGVLGDVAVSLTVPGVLVGLITSVSVGVAAGLYPARSASAVDPMEALRS